MSMLAAQPIPGLLFVVDGEYTKNNRARERDIQLRNTLRDGLTYIIEMRCFAAYHTTETDIGIGTYL